MKSKLYKILKQGGHPIAVQYELLQKEYKKFHYHEQNQITFVKKGRGTLICGNISTNFKDGDLFVIGKDISHVFVSDPDEIMESYSIYFYSDWLQNTLENNETTHFLQMASRVAHIESFSQNRKLVEGIINKAGVSRITDFFLLFNKITESKKSLLLSRIYKKDVKLASRDSGKLDQVFDYIHANYKRKITLDELAELSNLTKESFCRYFKQRTNRPVVSFINELRLNHACKALVNTDLGIEEIGYRSGFNNFSNFLRHFKKFTGVTPKQFRLKNKTLLSEES